jgi:anthranilate phosphoribosyltransferase
MEQLGYKLGNDPAKLKRETEKSNICFLHAPLFHPALKAVGTIRRNLGIRTFFNMLGPLVNPAAPKFQLIGVYNLEMARLYTYMLQKTNSCFAIIHSLDGYDELSLTGDARVITNDGERVMTPEQLGKRMVSPADIYGGSSPEEAAKIFLDILKGRAPGRRMRLSLRMLQWRYIAREHIPVMNRHLWPPLKVWKAEEH